jgi:hypothetical protein
MMMMMQANWGAGNTSMHSNSMEEPSLICGGVAAAAAGVVLACKRRLVSAPVRVNMVVSLADLASRWPNVLEPWTAYMYEPLSGANYQRSGQVQGWQGLALALLGVGFV